MEITEELQSKKLKILTIQQFNLKTTLINKILIALQSYPFIFQLSLIEALRKYRNKVSRMTDK